MTIINSDSFNDMPGMMASVARTAAFMRKTRQISYMISGWIADAHLASEQGGTSCLTLGIPDDFYAVRLAFPNKGPETWRMSRVIGTSSRGFGDFVHPGEKSDWIAFEPEKEAVTTQTHDKTGTITVKGLAEGESTYPDCVKWTWTAWAPIMSAPVTRSNDLRPLFLRAHVPSDQRVAFAVGQLRGLLGNADVNHGFDVFVGGIKFDIDLTGEQKEGGATGTWIDNQLVAGSMFPLVQVLTRHRGVVGLVAGDSHHQGTSTLEQFTGFAYRASTEAMMNAVGRTPVGFVNAAVGGFTTAQIFGRFYGLLDAINPSYAVLPGWTYNDDGPDGRADASAVRMFFAELVRAVAICETRGILPVLCTPFPRDAERMGAVQIGPWRWIRERILELGADERVLVLDATSVLGEENAGRYSGTYHRAMSNDQMHPDDEGHIAIARLLEPLLKVC